MRRIVAPAETAAERTVVRMPGNGTNKQRRSGGRRYGLWLAAAAAVFVAFGAGRQFGAVDRAGMSGTQIAQSEDIPLQAALPGEPPGRPTGDVVTLVVNDHRGVPHRVQVPLVEARQLGRQFSDTPPWSSAPALLQQLNEQGLELAARRRYAPLYFEQHERRIPMIVPVDDAVVTPVSRPVF
jgi:hypothetical protein